MIDISLIVPTLNEKENIKPLIEQIDAALKEYSYEVIIVDDNSSDGTADVVSSLAAERPSLRLIRRQGPKGLSAAVVEGFGAAKSQILAVMDADLSHDARLLPEFIRGIREGHEMAIGARYIKGGGADHWPWFRRFYSSLATVLAIKLFRLPVHDPMSGFFAVRREAFERAKPTLNPTGYKILLELVLRGQIKSVKEIPFIFKDRKQGYSKLSSRVASQYLLMLIQLRPYIWAFHLLRKFYHEGRYKKVIRMIKDGRLLDIGCGQPCETMPDQAFLRYLGRPHAAGLDIKSIQGPYEFHQGSIDQMPFPDNSFDNVVAMEVLEHVTDSRKSINEIKRILKPGGVFVMSTPVCNWFWNAVWDLWTKSIGQMWHEAHVVSLTTRDWANILQQDFELKKTESHWLFDNIYTCVKK